MLYSTSDNLTKTVRHPADKQKKGDSLDLYKAYDKSGQWFVVQSDKRLDCRITGD